MGSGVIAPAVAVGVCRLRGWKEPSPRRSLLKLLIIFALATFVGALCYESSRRQAPDYAGTLLDGLHAFSA